MNLFAKFIIKLFFKTEVNIMAIIYATLIIKGKKTVDQVPEIIRSQVIEILKDLEVTL